MRNYLIIIFLGLALSILLGAGVVKMGWFFGSIVLLMALSPILVRFPTISIYFFALGSFFNGLNVKLPFFVFGLGDLSSLMLIGVWVARRLFVAEPFHLPKGFVWLLGYISLVLLSLINGIDTTPSFGGYIRLLSRVVALFAFVDLVRSERVLIGCLYCVSGSGLIHAIIAFSLDSTGEGRLSGLIDQPNELGAYLALGLIPLVAHLQKKQPMLSRLLVLVGVGLLTTAVVLTGSRGIYAAIAAAFMWSSRNSLKRVILFGLVGVISVSTASLYSQKQVNAIERRLQFRDSSVQKRTNVLKVSKELIFKYPLLGIGFGQVGQAYKSISVEEDRGRATHSFLIAVAAASGLPALITILLFFWSQIRPIYQRIRRRKFVSDAASDADWLYHVVSTIMLFHFVSLLVRGAQLYDWSVFTVYASAAVLAAQASSEAPQGDLEPSMADGVESPTVDAGLSVSNKLV